MAGKLVFHIGIHFQLIGIYGDNVMGCRTSQNGCRKFENCAPDLHDDDDDDDDDAGQHFRLRTDVNTDGGGGTDFGKPSN
jgi:hypothetical protein